MKLVIGNKNYSSWSLRAWLHLRESGVDFEEVRIPLYVPGAAESIARFNPAGRVPVLIDDGVVVWDSLAIVEYVRERTGDRVGWPAERGARARARSIVAEMHSGFLGIREELPFNARGRTEVALDSLSETARQQIARVFSIWSECRTEHAREGDWLFGRFSIADAFYAPVALRFVTYGIAAPPAALSFIDAVRSLPSIRGWVADAERETEALDFIDQRAPASSTPLEFG